MNRFTGAFLIPGHRLRGKVGADLSRITYQEVMRLKQMYGVSAGRCVVSVRDQTRLRSP